MSAAELKRLICRLMVGLLLFAQMAVAAHACPGVPVGKPAAQRTMTQAMSGDMSPACRQMMAERAAKGVDKAVPNLCVEHCRHGQQSDQTWTPALPVAVLNSLYVVAALPEADSRSGRSPVSHVLPVADPPPHSILHCCFRL